MPAACPPTTSQPATYRPVPRRVLRMPKELEQQFAPAASADPQPNDCRQTIEFSGNDHEFWVASHGAGDSQPAKYTVWRDHFGHELAVNNDFRDSGQRQDSGV